jgi:ring-1,2-phenylacetyl-CoA epoxidase subunit PaaD
LLADVPDPEIPVLSVVDLGIVRDVAWRGEELEVAVTPTYSGCPATAVIALSIEEALRRAGVKKIRIRTVLSPPWTTAWISAEGREKLKKFGIAPPASGACAGAIAAGAPDACPHCGGSDLEEVSRFGSTPCKASWRCRECREPFDYFKSY